MGSQEHKDTRDKALVCVDDGCRASKWREGAGWRGMADGASCGSVVSDARHPLLASHNLEIVDEEKAYFLGGVVVMLHWPE